MNHQLLFGLLLFPLPTYAQLGIGTTTLDPSAQLEIVSTQRGFLPPRMSAQQRTTIPNPAEGLLVYQHQAPQGYYLFTQGNWQRLLTQDELSTALTAATAPSYGFAKRLTRQLLTAGREVSFPDAKQFSADIQPATADNSFVIYRPGVYQVSYSVTGRLEAGLVGECNGVEVVGSRIGVGDGEFTTRFILSVSAPNSQFVLKSLSRSIVDQASIELIRL